MEHLYEIINADEKNNINEMSDCSLDLNERQSGEQLLFLDSGDMDMVEYTDVLENQSLENEISKYKSIEDNLKIYLIEISNYPLLTVEEEKQLFIQYNNGDLIAREKLLKSNLRLVVSVAKKYLENSSLDFLDLIQEGNIGLIKAIDKFNVSKGYKFSTYAVYWIRKSIDLGIAEKGRTVKLSVDTYEKTKKIKIYINNIYLRKGIKPDAKLISSHFHISENKANFYMKNMLDILSVNTPINEDSKETLEDTLSDYYSLEDDVCKRVILKDIYKIMKEVLSEREYFIIKARAGYIEGREWTLEELGEALNTTKQNIRRIENMGLKKISENLKNKGYEIKNMTYVKCRKNKSF